jgi:hypothetical protein
MSYQSARLKHLLMLFVAFPAGAILSFVLAFRYGEEFILLGFLWAVLVELASRQIKCPVCDRPIGFGQYRIFSLRLEWWKAIPAQQCEYKTQVTSMPTGEPRRRSLGFVIEFVRVVFGATLVLMGVLMTMAERGEMIACGRFCENVSTTLFSISNGKGWALGTLLILVGVATWLLPKLRRG